MPRIGTNWEFNGRTPFADMNAEDPFETHLPSVERFQAAEVDPLFGVPSDHFAADGFNNFSDLSVGALYRVGSRWGIEDFRLDGVGTFATGLFNLTRMAPGPEAAEVAKQAVIGALDTAFSAIGVVPVVGPVVQGAYAFAKMLVEAIRVMKDERENIALPALRYNPEADQDMCRDAEEHIIPTNDWTRIFLPAVIPSSFASKLITFGTDRDGVQLKGMAIGPEEGNFVDVDGYGVIAGLPKVFSNIQVPRPYSSMYKRPSGWGHPPPFCAVTWYGTRKVRQWLCNNTGEFTPSLAQLGYTMWSMVRTNSANAFKIDQYAIRKAWQDYFEAYIDYIEWHGAKDPDSYAFQRAYNMQQMGFIGSCGYPEGKPQEWKCGLLKDLKTISGLKEWLQERYDDQPPGYFFTPRAGKGMTVSKGSKMSNYRYATYYALVDFFVADQLRACMQTFVKTMTVAYVDETFPAIAESIKLRQEWEKNRNKLLEHPARMNVELDMIPDKPYQDAMAAAQKLGGMKLVASPVDVPDVGEGASPDEPPHLKVVPARVAPRAGGGAGLLIAGLAAILLLGRRK
jgi:hypothetical protein